MPHFREHPLNIDIDKLGKCYFDVKSKLGLKSDDFYEITKRTLEFSKSFCNGKVVSILEGGYDLKALQNSSKRHVDALIEFN